MASVNLERPKEDRLREPAPKAGSRARYNRLMRVVRRTHLYAGLVMTPWVFLYGVTACLFNHPLLFPDQDARRITPADVAGTAIAQFAGAEQLARQVVAAINAGAPEGEGEGPYRLIRPDEAGFSRDYSTTLTDGRLAHAVRFNLETRTGTVRTSPVGVEPGRAAPAPFAASEGVVLDPDPLESVAGAIPAVLGRVGLPTEGLVAQGGPGGARGGIDGEALARPGRSPGSHRAQDGREPRGGPEGRSPDPGGAAEAVEGAQGPRGTARGAAEPGGRGGPVARGGRFGGPELGFLMEGSGQVWRVGYDLQTGALSGRPEGGVSGEVPSTRRFLLRLHTAHGYPDQYNARWFWAVVVDVMSVSMVGWGLTGLLMWWQMKNVRRVGAVVLLIGVVASVAAAVGMHGTMVGGP